MGTEPLLDLGSPIVNAWRARPPEQVMYCRLR
jgi:hypothetical protein